MAGRCGTRGNGIGFAAHQEDVRKKRKIPSQEVSHTRARRGAAGACRRRRAPEAAEDDALARPDQRGEDGARRAAQIPPGCVEICAAGGEQEAEQGAWTGAKGGSAAMLPG